MQPSLFTTPPPALSVGELMRHLKRLLEVDDIATGLWVRGEISNFTRAASGHLYFSLKDAEGAIRCVMWKTAAAQLTRRPADGDAARARGRVSLYEVRGDLQLYVEALEFDGVGALWQQFEALRARLTQEGLFDATRKRPLPLYPRCVGIVTSEKGAALQDMLRILSQRWPAVEVALCPTTVQGVEAPAQIAQAIERLNRDPRVQVIIIARGGGAIEDLWAFNDELVARAIYASRVPLVSGVGHETDFTIADFVADVRAPTLTAAAALVVPDQQDVRQTLAQQQQRMTQALAHALAMQRDQLTHTWRTLARLAPHAQLNRRRQQVDEQLRNLDEAARRQIQLRQVRLESKRLQLAALNPLAILARGYAIVSTQTAIVRQTQQVSPGDALTIRVSDGALRAEVK